MLKNKPRYSVTSKPYLYKRPLLRIRFKFDIEYRNNEHIFYARIDNLICMIFINNIT